MKKIGEIWLFKKLDRAKTQIKDQKSVLAFNMFAYLALTKTSDGKLKYECFLRLLELELVN